jgi:hypothetical protein
MRRRRKERNPSYTAPKEKTNYPTERTERQRLIGKIVYLLNQLSDIHLTDLLHLVEQLSKNH